MPAIAFGLLAWSNRVGGTTPFRSEPEPLEGEFAVEGRASLLRLFAKVGSGSEDLRMADDGLLLKV